jgi:hypothetical protein
VTNPSPAIVAQDAVRRLPRLALLAFCVAYVLPGFVGRAPWKTADLTAFGYMLELAQGHTSWMAPKLVGLPLELDGLLPYWLGAWAIQWAPGWVAPDLAARIPFIALLAVSLLATWYGTYFLARSPQAQPVAFAFGGEASPADYARAIADGGLLAFIACLGLAQLSHETTPAQVQLCCAAMVFYAFAALPYRTLGPALAGNLGLAGLALSGAPFVALLLGLGGATIHGLDRTEPADDEPSGRRTAWTWGLVGMTCFAAALATLLGLWRWRLDLPQANWVEWRNLLRLLLWFTWPAWPLVLWTLWRWRRQIASGNLSRHLALPIWFAAVALAGTFTTSAQERALLLALPALAALAAFALPTLGRSVAALIDWFTLLFFSGWAIYFWVPWISMQTGVPAEPAANIAKLVPGYVPSFSPGLFAIALCATLAWGWLVRWRVGRYRSAIWKSLVLPAGGIALIWLLLTTLMLPVFDYARSYVPLVARAQALWGADKPACVQEHGLSRSQIAALQYHGQLTVQPATQQAACSWLLVDKDGLLTLEQATDLNQWDWQSTIGHPSDKDEKVLVFRRR